MSVIDTWEPKRCAGWSAPDQTIRRNRCAMLAYMNDASNPQNAYPAFWAPFEIVA